MTWAGIPRRLELQVLCTTEKKMHWSTGEVHKMCLLSVIQIIIYKTDVNILVWCLELLFVSCNTISYYFFILNFLMCVQNHMLVSQVNFKMLLIKQCHSYYSLITLKFDNALAYIYIYIYVYIYNQNVPTKADVCLYFILIDSYRHAVMCRNSLLQDFVYIYSLLWGHTSQSSSRNIPLARESICFLSHQTADYC